jgi:acetaldehyde dehydrogenase/alcohol dehydrogenase
MPNTFKEAGINKAEYFAHLDDIALNAFDDQCTGANPRYPLVNELKDILVQAYGEAEVECG